MTWAATLIPVVLVVYLLLIDFYDLHPFNDVKNHTKENRKWEIFNYLLPLAASILSFIDKKPIVTSIAFLIAVLFLVGHILSWWIPYFFGCSEERKKHMKEHFSQTIKVLPPIKDHPIPDLEHLPVTILIISWFIAALLNL